MLSYVARIYFIYICQCLNLYWAPRGEIEFETSKYAKENKIKDVNKWSNITVPNNACLNTYLCTEFHIYVHICVGVNPYMPNAGQWKSV